MASQDPPSYEQAVGTARLSQRERNGISAQRRRSTMDYKSRMSRDPSPDGWVRTFDPENHHQFFVDIRADPPRSIWHHPYDDEEFLNSLPLQERERLGGLTRHPSKEDIAAETTDEEEGDSSHHTRAGAAHEAPPHQQGSSSKPRSFGRKMKDKITGTTHEERNAERARRQEREQDLYRQHELFRRGLAAAIQTNKPQLLGQDDDGMDVYLEPPDSNFPGVTSVRQLSPSLEEVFYAADAPGVPRGARHVRPISYSSYRGGGGMLGGGGMGSSMYPGVWAVAMVEGAWGGRPMEGRSGRIIGLWGWGMAEVWA
ncbi:hypothetical protein PG987_007228 [Apiospora arundinis]